MNRYEKKIYYNIPKKVIKCAGLKPGIVPKMKTIYNSSQIFITGEKATIGTSNTNSLISSYLTKNGLCIQCSTYVNDKLLANKKTGNTSSSNSNYLLHDYNKQWWVGNVANKRVSGRVR